MENKQTHESEKLISDFVGDKYVFKYINERDGFIGYYIAIDKNGNIDYDYEGINFLKYTTSLDWLFKAVEKINDFEDIEFKLVGSRASVKLPDGKRFISHTISILNSTVNVVVEFIKWYNNKKNEN